MESACFLIFSSVFLLQLRQGSKSLLFSGPCFFYFAFFLFPYQGYLQTSSRPCATGVFSGDRSTIAAKRQKLIDKFIIGKKFTVFGNNSLLKVGMSFHGQAFDDAWSFRSCSFKASRREMKQTEGNDDLQKIVDLEKIVWFVFR